MLDVQCPKCGASFQWHRRDEMKSRAIQFAIFGAVLMVTGGVLHFTGVGQWRWWLYLAGLVVLAQVVVKLGDYAWCLCPHCHHARHLWMK